MNPAAPPLTVAVALFGAATASGQIAVTAESLRWQQLAPIPDAQGFAAPFAGVSGGALIVAGGANIIGDKWAESFTKKWYDSVFVLERPDGVWKRAGTMPRSLGYGVSITVGDSLICIGGSDSAQHYVDVFQLSWKAGALSVAELPRLPQPCANACGALVGRTIYIAGGIETPVATTALKTFWSLDLDDIASGWRQLDPWPGPERMLAVAGVRDGSFFLFSGAKLSAGADGKPVREYLRDAYRFNPGGGWARLADMPRPAVAAPSPAPAVGDTLLLITGDDGVNVDFKPLTDHPGFPKNVLSFDVKKNSWSVASGVPFSRATVPVVEWHGHFVLPNGEVRPRERTSQVWRAERPELVRIPSK